MLELFLRRKKRCCVWESISDCKGLNRILKVFGASPGSGFLFLWVFLKDMWIFMQENFVTNHFKKRRFFFFSWSLLLTSFSRYCSHSTYLEAIARKVQKINLSSFLYIYQKCSYINHLSRDWEFCVFWKPCFGVGFFLFFFVFSTQVESKVRKEQLFLFLALHYLSALILEFEHCSLAAFVNPS